MRKRRTREHIIADLSANHVERHFLLSGHTAERVQFDYGYDLFVQTFDEQGELEPGYLLVQLKATDVPRRVSNGEALALTVERRDAEGWLADASPVVLIFYDAPADTAYWLPVQESDIAQQVRASNGATVTLRIPVANRIEAVSVEAMRRRKNQTFRRREIDGTNF